MVECNYNIGDIGIRSIHIIIEDNRNKTYLKVIPDDLASNFIAFFTCRDKVSNHQYYKVTKPTLALKPEHVTETKAKRITDKASQLIVVQQANLLTRDGSSIHIKMWTKHLHHLFCCTLTQYSIKFLILNNREQFILQRLRNQSITGERYFLA